MIKHFKLLIITVVVLYVPAITAEKDSIDAVAKANPVKFSAVVDMQVEKKLYDEYGSTINTTRIDNPSLVNYREAFDDFWMRVALKGNCRLQYLEGAFNLRFYPYWTMRRKMYSSSTSGGLGADLQGYLELLELNQAYIKAFIENTPKNGLTFTPHIKVGRDGLLNACGQLFGNYLDQPVGGYGASRTDNVVGPFKNRKIFANQLEVGFTFNVFNTFEGVTSLMAGANLNNEKFYQSSTTQYWQILDSKLSAGFIRFYQDFYFMSKRFHVGGGFRKYTAPRDSISGIIIIPNTYTSGQWTLDANILPGLKIYTEMGVQKMSSDASTGIVRPMNVGITIPTFGIVDTFAVEIENVSTTFFGSKSMRDPVAGREKTQALGWGLVVEKKWFDRCVFDWGLYTGNPTGDMKTTMRLTFLF
jgi:hypothetical protein